METIEVIYTCGTCSIIDKRVNVPIRGNENVKEWMDQTIRILMRDHWSEFPTCNPKKFEMVKIPIDGTQKVGGPQVN